MDMLRLASPTLIVVAAAFLCAAASPGSTPPRSVDTAAASNEFGFDLLNALQKTQPGKNVVLSPVSAALDLSIALNGASGQTADEMRKALALPKTDLDALNAANAELIKATLAPSDGVTLHIADSMWADSRRAAFRAAFVEQAKRWYDAQVADVDFSDAGTPARINRWVDEQTQGKIDKIVDRISPSDVALLLNALYFKGQWTHKFDPAQTKPKPFGQVTGASKNVPMMAQHGKFDYFQTAGVQAIRLPYGKNGELAMDVFLPANESGLAAFETQLTLQNWSAWQSRFAETSGTIELPRFELKAQYGLNDALQALGMRAAFNGRAADFRAMFEPGAAHGANFFISYVKQATYLRVDEEGSEAAAVTSIGLTMMAVHQQPPPFHMVVDHPFFCAIEDRRTRALLFVGAIYDPSP
ncbi:MAG: serpin family protein [Candidatus Eremiobacteraeota bacterium]|nr:serpin family protein [Candidatus Eremiobacteraeota bacterium]